MTMRFFYVLLIVTAFAACAGGDARPKSIVPPETMKVIMFDVIRAQEYASARYGKDTVALNANMPVLLQQVFAIHKIDRNDFYKSFSYYEAHPEDNQALFDSLAAYTDQMRQNYYVKPR